MSNSILKIRKEVEKGKFYLFMDALGIVLQESDHNISEVDINELLEDFEIGYRVSIEPLHRRIVWSVRDNVDDITTKIEETQKVIKAVSEQAYEHLEQAKRQLDAVENERARKDSVRDLASAMESIIKTIAGINDIKVATKALRDAKIWGKDDIVKDGEAIFNKLHHLYPDFRHGSIEKSYMSLNEARYWIDRMSAYLCYMSREKDELDSI